MALIDFDKFLASFITEMKECSQMRNFSIPRCIKKALDDQGLEYKDGEIVKSQRKVSAEAKENGYGESEDEEIVKLADEYYDKVLIKECDMEEKEAHHCRISYIHGAKAMLEKQGQKSAWSEEDEYTLNETIQHLKLLIEIDKAKHCACDVQYYQRDIDWLKTIKQRYTWKPSKEQMDAMQMAVSYFGYSWASKEQKLLESLYDDLKKL